MQVQYIHQSCPASLSTLRHVHVYLGTAARRRCRLLREIPPKGFPTCLGLQRELTSSNFKLLEYPRKKERSPCSVGRLDGWVAGSLLVTKEGCRILEDSNMWCSSSLEILFWVSMRRRRRHHIGLLSWRVIGDRECGSSSRARKEGREGGKDSLHCRIRSNPLLSLILIPVPGWMSDAHIGQKEGDIAKMCLWGQLICTRRLWALPLGLLRCCW